MTVVTMHTAKSTLSQLLARAEAGEEIVLARGRIPVARLVPIQTPGTKRRFGALRGLITIGADFADPLPEEELAGWE